MKELLEHLRQANRELAEQIKEQQKQAAEWFGGFEKRKQKLKGK
jgi:hypothetical protein